MDVNSTKDTLSFSMGKDAKVQALRTPDYEKSKTKTIGSRQKFEVAWEIKVKNNGGAEIPLLVKDQFPVSTNNDIKVKRAITAAETWMIKQASLPGKRFYRKINRSPSSLTTQLIIRKAW